MSGFEWGEGPPPDWAVPRIGWDRGRWGQGWHDIMRYWHEQAEQREARIDDLEARVAELERRVGE